MMPFSIIRTLILGLFGWTVLGLGIYFLYEWRYGNNGVEPVPISVEEPDDSDAERTRDRTIVVQHDRRDDKTYLYSGLALVLLSTGGGWPIWRGLFRLVFARKPRRALGRLQRLERPDGSELAVEHIGPEDAPVLLCTHGWTLDRGDWDDFCAAFGDRYHIVLWDLAGLGDSSAPENGDHSLEKMAHDLEAVLTQVTTGPVVLIGHSIGGMIQQVFCRLFPQHFGSRVRGFAFVHTTYINPTETAIGGGLLRALQEPVLKPLTYVSIWLAPLFWLSNWQSYWNGSLHLSARLFCFAGRQTWQQVDYVCYWQAKAWPAVVGRGSLAMTRLDERATLPQVHLPVLVVAGADDRLTKPEASDVLANLFPDAQIVRLAPAGHFGHWEHPEEFHAAIASFVDATLTSASKTVPNQSFMAATTGTDRS